MLDGIAVVVPPPGADEDAAWYQAAAPPGGSWTTVGCAKLAARGAAGGGPPLEMLDGPGVELATGRAGAVPENMAGCEGADETTIIGGADDGGPAYA